MFSGAYYSKDEEDDDDGGATIEKTDDESQTRPVEWRPTSPRGATIDFYCCEEPDVRWMAVDGEERAICRNCGYDWTERME